MLRRFTPVGVILLGLLSLAQAPATVPTTQRVVTTAPAAPPPPASAGPASAPTASTPAPHSVEQARQGVVVVERQGKPLALGALLEGDGRILTALSPLGNGNFLTARYSDGAVAQLKLAHSDRGWDLALLAPTPTPSQPLRKSGLRAASAPSFVGLQSFTAPTPTPVTGVPATLKLSPGLLGGDGTPLTSAYELGTKPGLVGAPVVNAEGEVVALVARACPAPAKAGCVPVPYAAPVSALKRFLQRTPAEATWLGVEAAADETGAARGVRVIAVMHDSPAAFAGVRPGRDATAADVIVAVNGAPVSTPGELNEAVRSSAPGDSVELLLFGMGHYRHVLVRPRAAPHGTAPAPHGASPAPRGNAPAPAR